jgi:hypothetical protein
MPEISWRWLSDGCFNPAGALSAATTFSYSDGKFPLKGQPKIGPCSGRTAFSVHTQ